MMWSHGKLIVLEGGDGSGKATQSQLLLSALQKKHQISFFEFPRYKRSEFGKLTRRALDGEFGDFLSLSPYLSSLPYILDRARAKYLLLEALKEGHVICDRYTPSNLAHQGAKLSDRERNKFIEFIEVGEYKELGLPAPDIVLYLWVPIEITSKLLLKRYAGKKDKMDAYEANLEYQDKVRETYLKIAKLRKNWHIVKCFKGKNKLLTRSDIHKKILKIVQKELKLKI